MGGFRNLALVSTVARCCSRLGGCDARRAGRLLATAPPATAAKCDTPVGNDEQCKLREVRSPRQYQSRIHPHRYSLGLRRRRRRQHGRRQTSRGQEYCEYFAIIPATRRRRRGRAGPKPSTSPANTGDRFDPATKGSVCFEGDEGDHCRVTLSEDQAVRSRRQP